MALDDRFTFLQSKNFNKRLVIKGASARVPAESEKVLETLTHKGTEGTRV